MFDKNKRLVLEKCNDNGQTIIKYSYHGLILKSKSFYTNTNQLLKE